MISVLRQNLPAAGDLEVLVIDNTRERSAHDWVARLQAQDARVRYLHEPAPGISHARNAGVMNAAGDFLAFLDDDEIAAPDWLDTLYQALQDHHGDIATGPVHPVFEDEDSLDWDPHPFFHGAREKLATGAPLEAARTGNILFRTASCFDGAPPFDPGFGLSGGEDTDLTHRLHLAGRKIIWVADAHVREFWPPEKSSLSAFLRRKRVTARNTTRARVGASPSPVQAVLGLCAKSVVQLLIFVPLAALTYFPDRQRFAACAMHVNSALGKLTFWYRTGYYRANKEPAS